MKSAVTIENYEEFFLLYVDNELSAGDRSAVEEFVQTHPDLAMELEMLMQVQLHDEPLGFGDKKSLYRKESAEISLANYEEHFLLLVDNELTPDTKQKVETFVLQHPALQEGFTLLKQTKLEAEAVVFADKQSLYRKEEKERPVFYLRWQQIAIAAALIGLVVMVWNVLPGDKQTPQTIAQLKTKNVPGISQQNNGNTASTDRIVNNNGNNNGGALKGNDQLQSTTLANNNAVVINKSGTAVINPSNTNTTATVAALQPVTANSNSLVNNNTIAFNEAPQTKDGKPANGETVSTDNHNSFQTGVSSTQKVSVDRAALENNAIVAVNTDAATGGPNNIDVQPAVYKELDTEDDKKSLLLGSLEINKDKLRGFFRKAGSIFRSKSKAEDEKTEGRPSTTTRSLP